MGRWQAGEEKVMQAQLIEKKYKNMNFGNYLHQPFQEKCFAQITPCVSQAAQDFQEVLFFRPDFLKGIKTDFPGFSGSTFSVFPPRFPEGD